MLFLKRIGQLAIALALVLVACRASSKHAPPTPPAPIAGIWPTTGWLTATPESQGVDSNALATAIETIRARHRPVHSVLLERNGHIVLDATFFPFHSDETHDLASVTKSLISTLVGIAQRDHRLGSVDQPVTALLPARNFGNDAGKNRITLANLLSMTSGLDCRAPAGVNMLREMEQSPDWVAFTWNLPQTWAPGANFDYCGGGMHIVSAVLTAATGASAFDLARRELFAPLGITRSAWAADLYGNSHGFADLELSPRDAAKLGYLWLHYGHWENAQIVPMDYLRAALTGRAVVQSGVQYGYGFWVYPSHTPYDYEANGRGGQRITVIPTQNTVEVVTSGGADANAVAPLLAAAIYPTALQPNPAGQARLAAAIAAAATPPAPTIAAMIPAWASAIAARTYVVSDNPLGLRTIRLTFAAPDRASVQLGFASGAMGEYGVGLDGVPRLTWDAASGHRVAMSGYWRQDSFDLVYNTVALIDEYRLRIAPVPNGLSIHLMERTGPTDVMLTAVPQPAVPQPAVPQLAVPQVAAPQIAVPQLAAPQLAAPQIAVPQIAVPQVNGPPPP
jgi:CubicO group peptidase (beta-lactamase class C family)